MPTPLFWLARDDDELYFVNSSNDELEFVRTTSSGYATADDDVMIFGLVELDYQNVKPNCAVKITEYTNPIVDSDFIFGANVELKSSEFGHMKILGPSKRGGNTQAVLLWDTLESGKYVYVNNLDEEG